MANKNKISRNIKPRLVKKREAENIPKEEKIERERQHLLNKLASVNLKDIITRVAFILNQYSETRNSDVALVYRYWETFQEDYFNDGKIEKSHMFKLERYTSLTRARAKIQNEYHLFQANASVKKFRRSKEDKLKEEEIANKPGYPFLNFFIDESGKEGRFLILGGICISNTSELISLQKHIDKWKRSKAVKDMEFHFKELKNHQINIYQDFVNEFVSIGSTLSFKAVVLDVTNIKKSVDKILAEMYLHLIVRGIKHEIFSGRAKLPRNIDLLIDQDGLNKLQLENLRNNLDLKIKQFFKEHSVTMENVESVDSKKNVFIQLADLYVASISRRLNNPGHNFKDQFVENLFKILKIDNNFNCKDDRSFIYYMGDKK